MSRCASLSLAMKLMTVTSRVWPYPVTASYTLLDALWVPWQVIVNNRVAELQVEALRAGLGGDEYARPGLELVQQG